MNRIVSLTLLSLLISMNASANSPKLTDAKTAKFMNIAGFINKGFFIKKRINLNQDLDRSPNPKEYETAEASYKINYDLFINDAEYKCRRPTFYKYFQDELKISPHADTECKMNHQVTLISESTTSSAPLSMRNVDPSRIYQIHYLFAGKGKQMMSRWGHAMFRIVLCAPGRAVGPDCLQDYSQHIVVSYRANVEDMNIDYTKGMKGAYASQLFLMNMNEVVAEYTKGEFRDVISLPMKMSRQEITNFTDKMLENYWSYKGKYYFITNNCATEAMNLLRSAFTDNQDMQTANIVTPLGLFDYLVKNKITDLDILNDKKQAIRSGYLFPGMSDKLQKSLNLFVNDSKVSYEEFALRLSPASRLELYKNTISNHSDKLILLANALRLEE